MNKRMIVRTATVLMALTPLPSSAGRQAAPGAPAAVIEKGDFRFSYDERGISAPGQSARPVRRDADAGGRPAPEPARTGPRARPRTHPPLSPCRVRGDWSELFPRGPKWEASPGAERSAIRAAARRRPSRSSRPSRPTAVFSTGPIDLEATGPLARRGRRPGHQRPVGRADGGESRPDLRARLPQASVHLRPRLVLLLRARLGRAAVPAGHGPSGHEARVHGRRRRRGGTTGLRPLGPDGRRRDARHLAPGAHGARACPGRPAGEQGLVRLPDAVGRELRGAPRPRSTAEGLFDIRVVPGMTVPENLTARFSLHTKAKIEAIQAGVPRPDQDHKRSPASIAGHRVYEVAFEKLGENMLTIVHDGGRRTYLEFFVTEPMETLIKKRARVPRRKAADQGPVQVVERRLRAVRHGGQGHPDDRGSGHLPRPHGLRPDLRRPGLSQGALSSPRRTSSSRTRRRSSRWNIT